MTGKGSIRDEGAESLIRWLRLTRSKVPTPKDFGPSKASNSRENSRVRTEQSLKDVGGSSRLLASKVQRMAMNVLTKKKNFTRIRHGKRINRYHL